eukprot:6560523-Lingulodinium_polyedra.AAC.1
MAAPALDSEHALLANLLSRGGHRQQERVALHLEPQGSSTASSLADRLLVLVGWGIVSSSTARWLAEGPLRMACNVEN